MYYRSGTGGTQLPIQFCQTSPFNPHTEAYTNLHSSHQTKKLHYIMDLKCDLSKNRKYHKKPQQKQG